MKNAVLWLAASATLGLAQPAMAQLADARLADHAAGAPVAATPISVPMTTAPLVGGWGGQLAVPGNKVAVNLAVSETGGRLSAVLETPLAKLNHHAMAVTQRRDTVRFYDPAADISFVGLRSADGQQLAGHWQQPGFRQALVLTYSAPALPVAGAKKAASAKAAARTTYTSKWGNGLLENGKPVGEWKYFRRGPDGKFVVSQIYNHDTGKLLYGSSDGEACKAELSPGQWGFTPLTQSPWFIGGHDALAELTNQMRYPAEAAQAGVKGTVIVSFVVDTLGHLSDHRIVRSLGSGCDEEALRVAKTIPDTWTPARLGNKAVAALYYLTLAFKMD